MTFVRMIELIGSPSAERAQQLGASSVSFVPSGSDSVSNMTRVWPADTATGGISFLVADLGNVGALAGPEGLEGTASVQSMEMGNWTEKRFGCLD